MPGPRRGAAPLMHLSTLTGEGGFSMNRPIALTDRTVQDALISNLRRTLEEKGYRGLDGDFEYVFPEDASAYAAFSRPPDRTAQSPWAIRSSPHWPPRPPPTSRGCCTRPTTARHCPKPSTKCATLVTYEWGYTYHHTGPR